MSRAEMLCAIFDGNLATHPAAEILGPEIEAAAAALEHLYQRAALLRFGAEVDVALGAQ